MTLRHCFNTNTPSNMDFQTFVNYICKTIGKTNWSANTLYTCELTFSIKRRMLCPVWCHSWKKRFAIVWFFAPKSVIFIELPNLDQGTVIFGDSIMVLLSGAVSVGHHVRDKCFILNPNKALVDRKNYEAKGFINFGCPGVFWLSTKASKW